MTPQEQTITLRSIAKRLVREVADLEERVQKLEELQRRVWRGSIAGMDGTLTVTLPPQWEEWLNEPDGTP